ncbi:RrF2 family transcriptional regulator [Pelosinus sp. sgz500959]|uniref:RrF2 family transcriptional regulator n=1 Tax=Pelosinus sp. sgz500959 TaxID=3242472 RepID=UPI003673062E
MQFNQGTDYAFRVIMHLAGLPEGVIANSQTIAEEQNIPAGFLQKVMRALTKGEVIKSYRGTDGGFALAKSAVEISLLDIITVMEGPIDLQRCLKDHDACNRQCANQCPVHAALAVIQSNFIQSLAKVNFAEMINK